MPIVVIGGGVIGCSIAWHLRAAGEAGPIVVLERDPTYRLASSRLAFGGIRQLFASPVNVALARRSVAFYRRFDELLTVDGRPATARFRQRGYLFLATDSNAATLERRFATMTALGVAVRQIEPGEIARLVPGIALDDVHFALFGPEDGYADAPAVLAGFRAGCESQGVDFVADELASMESTGGRVRAVSTRGGVRITTDRVVCAAGAFSAAVGRAAGVEIPVVPVRQQLVRASLPRPWPHEFPVVVDPSGVHWRSAEGNTIVIARTETDEPAGEFFEADVDRFDRRLREVLVRRVPTLAGVEAAATWAGLYEMTADHNPLLGEHLDLGGFFLACGFSGHGLMMAPATGEVVAAMLRGEVPPVDVTALRPSRFRENAPLLDEAMI